jgi:hypothetical protein
MNENILDKCFRSSLSSNDQFKEKSFSSQKGIFLNFLTKKPIFAKNDLTLKMPFLKYYSKFLPILIRMTHSNVRIFLNHEP